MKRIWKYPLIATDEQVISVPKGAKLLTVQMQNGKPCLWAEVDTRSTGFNPTEGRRIGIFGTGNPMPDDPGKYISTFQMFDGSLVFHAYELPE